MIEGDGDVAVVVDGNGRVEAIDPIRGEERVLSQLHRRKTVGADLEPTYGSERAASQVGADGESRQ